jgi:hypothetical protein
MDIVDVSGRQIFYVKGQGNVTIQDQSQRKNTVILSWFGPTGK